MIINKNLINLVYQPVYPINTMLSNITRHTGADIQIFLHYLIGFGQYINCITCWCRVVFARSQINIYAANTSI